MRVNIDEIKEAGLDRRWDVTREVLDAIVQGDRAGWRARGAAHLDVRFEKLDRRVLVRGTARAELDGQCSRCLAPVALDLPVDFTLTLVPADEYEDKAGAGEDKSHHPVAGSFDAGDAEEDVYTGKVIDLDPIVREQVVLALPGYPVCQDDCKGLCSVCGTNLNERECGCDRKVPDPRWAGLAKVKLQ
jgi:DUF177 domain-containing protein